MIETLQSLTPALKARRRLGWIYAILILACAIGVIVAAPLLFGDDDWSLKAGAVLIGSIGLVGTNRWVASGQQKLIMPHLAKAVHLDYQQDATSFLNELPKRLFPSAMEKKAEDCISGTLGDRPVAMAEVKVETGGKGSRIRFLGFVIRFQNATALPAFFIAPKAKTLARSGRLNVTDLIEVESIASQNGETYGVWLSKQGVAKRDPALNTVVNILTNLETRIGVDANLYSATSNGKVMHIALSHKRDLFRFGGLFTSQNRIMENMKTALDDLNIPFRIVSILLEAERQAEQSVKD